MNPTPAAGDSLCGRNGQSTPRQREFSPAELSAQKSMPRTATSRARKVCMLLANPYSPDDRVRQEAMALKRGGYEVTILAWDRDCRRPETEQHDGVKIIRARIRAGYGETARQITRIPRLWRWYVQRLHELRPDAIHCHDLDTLPAGVWFTFTHRTTRLVFDAHECYLMMIAPHAPKVLGWCIRLSEKLLAPRAHLLIAPCKATGQYYRRNGRDNFVVVGNWKKPEDFKFPNSAIERKRADLKAGERLTIVYVGSLDADRVVLPLVEAVRGRPNLFLVLGGKGDQTDCIQQACAGAGNVRFLGYVHPGEVPLVTAAADVVYYGFDPKHPLAEYNAPNKLYEALAAGKAVLASDIGGELSEVIRSTGCGLLVSVPDAESIGRALDTLSDPAQLAEIQQRAREAGQHTFNWSTCELRLTGAYDRLFSQSRAPVTAA